MTAYHLLDNVRKMIVINSLRKFCFQAGAHKNREHTPKYKRKGKLFENWKCEDRVKYLGMRGSGLKLKMVFSAPQNHGILDPCAHDAFEFYRSDAVGCGEE